MKTKSKLNSIIAVLILSTAVFSQQPNQGVNLAPNAPPDKAVTSNNARQFEDAIRPYVELARKSYPDARERFLKGLPPKHSFFITTRLRDAAGHFEQVFIAVKEISDGRIKGLIWSDIQAVTGYQHGDPYTFAESELIDWTISNPDGTEEGNFVGKFLDTYQPQPVAEPTVWRSQPVTPERISQRLEEAAVKYQADAPYSRGALWDIAYPRNDQEYAALDGHAVILITALAQQQEELPLKRVYVVMDGKEIDLKPIKQVLSKQSAANSLSAKMFGAYRVDALYLLPVYLRMRTTDLMVDYAKNKTASKVGIFGGEVSAGVSKLTIKPPTGAGPTDKILDEFIKREFPSFFKE